MVVPIPSYSDILKMLEQLPIGKTLLGLPKRVAELERKVQALETAAGAKVATPAGNECPICCVTMKVVKETADPNFAFAGVKVHQMVCGGCGEQTTRTFEPGKGYR